jgi:hypothetical protein
VDNGRGRRALVRQPAQITMLAALWDYAAARGWDGRVRTASTWVPRAAASVATSTSSRPERKSARAPSRWLGWASVNGRAWTLWTSWLQTGLLCQVVGWCSRRSLTGVAWSRSPWAGPS